MMVSLIGAAPHTRSDLDAVAVPWLSPRSVPVPATDRMRSPPIKVSRACYTHKHPSTVRRSLRSRFGGARRLRVFGLGSTLKTPLSVELRDQCRMEGDGIVRCETVVVASGVDLVVGADLPVPAVLVAEVDETFPVAVLVLPLVAEHIGVNTCRLTGAEEGVEFLDLRDHLMRLGGGIGAPSVHRIVSNGDKELFQNKFSILV